MKKYTEGLEWKKKLFYSLSDGVFEHIQNSKTTDNFFK